MEAMAVRSAAMLLALLFQPQACNALATVQRSESRAEGSCRLETDRAPAGAFSFRLALAASSARATSDSLGAYFERRRRGNGVDAAPSTTRR